MQETNKTANKNICNHMNPSCSHFTAEEQAAYNAEVKQTAMQSRLWIQEYNAAGDNWIDYCGFDPSKTLDEACDDMLATSTTFMSRKFRVIRRFDEVIHCGLDTDSQKRVKRGTWRRMATARWTEAGRPIKRDKEGNLWSFACNDGSFCCIIEKVEEGK